MKETSSLTSCFLVKKKERKRNETKFISPKGKFRPDSDAEIMLKIFSLFKEFLDFRRKSVGIQTVDFSGVSLEVDTDALAVRSEG